MSLERRIEGLVRELSRIILEYALQHIDSTDRPTSFDFDGSRFRPNRRTWKTLQTMFGRVRYQRWYFQTKTNWYRGLAAMDVRLGLIAGGFSPALAYAMGQMAAELPQQAVQEQVRQRFSVKLSNSSYRHFLYELTRVVIQPHHDKQAIEQLLQWIEQSRQIQGKQAVLLQVGRDGVHVPLRSGWRESACATLSVFDRNGKRVGTIYLGEAPRQDQLFMTRRLTYVLTQTLQRLQGELPTLRYVIDAGAVPQSYFKDVLSKMKHPLTGQQLVWSWGVDFYHACQYVTKIGDALFGANSQKSLDWSRECRKLLRDEDNGVSQVLRRASQQERRHGLQGKGSDFDSGIAYLKKYAPYMDYAVRRRAGQPIGSGITEAGCKVIFNQRFKQSGMRWNKDTMQNIIYMRTACRSKIWSRIWIAKLSPHNPLPPINQRLFHQTLVAA